MFELKPLTCQSCGAPINRQTLKCDYCGTEYKRDNDGVTINYVVERPGVHRIRAKVSVPDELIFRSPNAAQEFVLDKMREQIAEGLLGYMKIYTENDRISRCQIIMSEVRVVDPTFTEY